MIMSVPGVTPRTSSQPCTIRGLGTGRSSGVRIEFDTGETLTLTSPTLIGRDPAPLTGETTALQAISDPSFSFSKTHLLIDPDRRPDHRHRPTFHQRSARRTSGRNQRLPARRAAASSRLPATLRIGSRWMKLSRV